MPFMPGTAGSLIGIAIYYLTSWITDPIQICLFALYFLVSYKSLPVAIEYFGSDDPSRVVCDEILGMWLTLIFFELTNVQIFLAFLLFRLFDIVKPYPIKKLERRFKGPSGIIIDDLMAGVYSKAALYLIMFHTF